MGITLDSFEAAEDKVEAQSNYVEALQLAKTAKTELRFREPTLYKKKMKVFRQYAEHWLAMLEAMPAGTAGRDGAMSKVKAALRL